MRYGLRETTSIERLLGYATSVIAALEATSETAGQAGRWKELRMQLRVARDARDGDREAVLGASARVRVRDAEWDAAVTDLSGRAWLAAGKDAAASPYGELFGAVKASEAVALGAAKAQALGNRLVAKAREVAHSDLAAAVERVAAANEALAAAGGERDAAVDKALLNDIRRRALLRQVEELADATEVAILTGAPGRRDLVSAVLAAPDEERPRRAGGGTAPAEPEADGEA